MSSGMTTAVSATALRVDLVDGANATTATLTGATTDDTLLLVLHMTVKGTIETLADITSDVTITADDTITYGSDYSSDQCLIIWHDASVAQGETLREKSAPCLKIGLADGAAATTSTLTGINTEDDIISVIHITTKADIASMADVTSHITISDADEITSDADYSNDQLLVFWMDNGGYDNQAYSNVCYKFDLVAGHATASTVTGITADDQIIFVGHFSTAASVATLADYTSGATAGAGSVAWAATTADDHMLIVWNDVSG